VQAEFNFEESRGNGYKQWQETRKKLLDEFSKSIGIPLGHRCEVWLKGEIRLRGLLRIREEALVLEEAKRDGLQLEIDGVCFRASEIESCRRMD
jgi:hypothetical protein